MTTASLQKRLDRLGLAADWRNGIAARLDQARADYRARRDELERLGQTGAEIEAREDAELWAAVRRLRRPVRERG